MERITHNKIQQKIDYINTFLGTNYETKYRGQGFGYDLGYTLPSGGWSRGYIGFDIRKNAKEMANYLDGVINTISAIKNNVFTIK